jgi:maleate isomerase
MRTELGYRAQMGVMTPATNTTAEPELYLMGPAGVTFHSARIYVAGGSREDGQGPIPAMLETPLRDLALMEPDHILLGMSAPSFAGGVEGDERLRAAIEQRMGAPVTTSGEAALAALQAYKVRRIGLLSPYAAEMDEQTTGFFTGAGYEVVRYWRLERGSPASIAAVAERVIQTGIQELVAAGAEAVVQVGNNLVTARLADEAERWTGVPVIAINAALLWHGLRKAGITDQVRGFGTLLRDF